MVGWWARLAEPTCVIEQLEGALLGRAGGSVEDWGGSVEENCSRRSAQFAVSALSRSKRT